jgi:hypothetical protein
MSRPILNFADAISPVSPGQFLAETWETRPLHLRPNMAILSRGLLIVSGAPDPRKENLMRMSKLRASRRKHFFFEKRSKKLLTLGVRGPFRRTPVGKSFPKYAGASNTS